MCRSPRAARSSPSSRIPVPASSTSTEPLASDTSMQDVFPPAPTVFGPGAGIEPRHPQILTRTPENLLSPEDRDDPDEFVRLGEERKRGHGESAIDAVAAGDPHLFVRRLVAVEGDPSRPLLRRERLGGICSRTEARDELLVGHLPDLRKRSAHDGLGGLVEEYEPTLGVDDECRRGEVRREFARKDQDQVLLPAVGHYSARFSSSAFVKRTAWPMSSSFTFSFGACAREPTYQGLSGGARPGTPRWRWIDATIGSVPPT